MFSSLIPIEAFASSPTINFLSPKNSTTDGVIFFPSAFGTISDEPPSAILAIALNVVPKSIPTISLIYTLLFILIYCN